MNYPEYPKTNNSEDKSGLMPYNQLELEYLTTNPAWGREVTNELNKKLRIDYKKDEDGNILVDQEFLWGILSYYTRDLRLANLSGPEIRFCQEWLDFAGSCLSRNYPRAFMSSMRKVITILELSQSKGGFLRKRLGTLTREEISSVSSDASKKKLLGGKKTDG